MPASLVSTRLGVSKTKRLGMGRGVTGGESMPIQTRVAPASRPSHQPFTLYHSKEAVELLLEWCPE